MYFFQKSTHCLFLWTFFFLEFFHLIFPALSGVSPLSASGIPSGNPWKRDASPTICTETQNRRHVCMSCEWINRRLFSLNFWRALIPLFWVSKPGPIMPLLPQCENRQALHRLSYAGSAINGGLDVLEFRLDQIWSFGVKDLVLATEVTK